MPEYRDDDLVDRGFCPECGRELSGLMIDGRGFCEVHGQQWAEWLEPIFESEEEEE